MGFLDKIASFFQKKTTASTSNIEVEKVPDIVDEPVVEQVEDLENLTEEEQQLLQIKNFIQSDDISNHQLAAMFMQSLSLDLEEEQYELIGKSAEKMTFWAKQDLPSFRMHYKKLIISARFFSQYNEIAEFAEILPLFKNITELRWDAGPYWNQHPILTAAGKLPKLRVLHATNCKMHYLSEELCNCKTLEELYLTKNKLHELPSNLENLRSLKILELSENQFRRCPKNISTLKKLEVLYFHENPLIDVEPRIFGRLYKLNDLRLPSDLAKFYVDTLKDWLPDVDFKKSYWQFD